MFNHDYIVLVYDNSHKSLAKILKFSDLCKYYLIFFAFTDNFLQNIANLAQNGRKCSMFLSVCNLVHSEIFPRFKQSCLAYMRFCLIHMEQLHLAPH